MIFCEACCAPTITPNASPCMRDLQKHKCYMLSVLFATPILSFIRTIVVVAGVR